MSAETITDDIQVEAAPGLPEPLPPDEHMLWQGRPNWKAVAVDVFHVRAVLVYAVLLIAWRVFAAIHDGRTPADVALIVLWLTLLPIGAVAILCVLARITAGSTVYTITSRRVVMRIGVALTVTINLPFTRITSAAYKPGWFGTGDIPLTLGKGDRIGYMVLWPHARPWVLRNAEPMLRCVPEGEKVATILSRAMAMAAHQAPRAIEAPAHRAGASSPGPAAVVAG